MATSNSAPPRPAMDFSRIAFALASDSERVCRERPRRCNHAALSGIKTISRHPYRKTAGQTSAQYRALRGKPNGLDETVQAIQSRQVLCLARASTAHSDQQCSHAAGEQRYRCRFRHDGTHYAIGEVGVLALYLGRCEESAKEGAIEERVMDRVVAASAYAVGAASGRIKRTARAVVSRRDIEPILLACWQSVQRKVQSVDPDHL